MPPYPQLAPGHHTMRLFRFQAGRFRHLPLPEPSARLMQHVDVETLIRQNLHIDGTISSLCLDFCGSYVTLQHEDEIRLAARLLCTYHNSLLPRGPHQSPREFAHESPPVGPVSCPVDLHDADGGPWVCPRGPRAPRAPRDTHAPRVLYAPPSVCARADTNLQKLKQQWQRLAAIVSPDDLEHRLLDATDKLDEFGLPHNDAGHSDSDDEKENNRRLQWDFEVNADVDGTPNFGKAKMENRLW